VLGSKRGGAVSQHLLLCWGARMMAKEVTACGKKKRKQNAFVIIATKRSSNDAF